MLNQLLALLDDGHTYTQQELAVRLDVTPDSVAASMDYLARLGLLRRVSCASGGCGGSCKSCGGGCATGNAPAMWEKVSHP